VVEVAGWSFGEAHGAGVGVVAEHGAFLSAALWRHPADPRRRSAGGLSFAEREEISRGLAAGLSLRAIAAGLGRAPSTVSREVGAHGGRRRYRAATADQLAWSSGTRPKTCKLASNPALAAIVAEQLQRRWSPQQIAGWLKSAYPDNQQMQVSHESIYRTLFVQSRGALRRELTGTCAPGGSSDVPKGRVFPTDVVVGLGFSTSPNVQQRPRIVPCPAIGKATSSSANT
jgi:hypothetical protein